VKIHIETFGCRANHYDSEVVRALALNAGHEVVDEASEADLAVVNSCAVTSEAERDARRAIRRIAARRPNVRTVVMGCAAALQHNDEVFRALPGVEHVVAGADVNALAAILGADPAAASTTRQDSARAVLRIQDGCDEHCTFCATTHARGANRSRSSESIVREAQRLAEHHPEIVLTGTHIGTYGVDIESSLGVLIERLMSDVPSVRFRLSSVEATEVDDRLFELLTSGDRRITPYLHAPLQSGSDRLLKRMGRHWYTAESYATAVERIAAKTRAFGLGADIIVGFPGETDADYAATEQLIERLPFTYLHVFVYSPRPGTPATRLPDHVPLGAAQARSSHLRHLGQKKGKEYRASRSGGTADIVVIQGPPRREGLTEDFLNVSLEGFALARGERFEGTLRLDAEALTCHFERSEESAVGDPLALHTSV
jgi:threonylcarbamoyladenosine tRNA methylthiotransferase MtaB